MDDLIERQAAIDAVLDRMNVEKHGRDAKPEEIQWTLEKLPSAQPEIIRCKDCKHKPTRTDRDSYKFPDDCCPCKCEDYWYSWNPADDWFCANGERKSDE